MEHIFCGTHYIVSYYECNDNLLDNQLLNKIFIEAIKESGANILNQVENIFDNGGYTALFLLSESHASIHTYPEFKSCFIDLFTCGTKCDYRLFDIKLKKYLNPKKYFSSIINKN